MLSKQSVAGETTTKAVKTEDQESREVRGSRAPCLVSIGQKKYLASLAQISDKPNLGGRERAREPLGLVGMLACGSPFRVWIIDLLETFCSSAVGPGGGCVGPCCSKSSPINGPSLASFGAFPPTKPHPRDTTRVDPSPSCPPIPSLPATKLSGQPAVRPVSPSNTRAGVQGSQTSDLRFLLLFSFDSAGLCGGEVMNLRVMQIGAVLRHF